MSQISIVMAILITLCTPTGETVVLIYTHINNTWTLVQTAIIVFTVLGEKLAKQKHSVIYIHTWSPPPPTKYWMDEHEDFVIHSRDENRGSQTGVLWTPPTWHCLSQRSRFLRWGLLKWSHAFCLLAAMNTRSIWSTSNNKKSSSSATC